MPQEHNERRLWSCFWMSSLDLRQRSNSSSFQILCPLKYVLLQVIIIFYLESKSLEMGLEEYPVKSQQEKRGHQGSEISNDPEGNQGLTNNPGKESVSVVCDTKMSCASDKQRTLSSSEKWEPEPDCKEMRNVSSFHHTSLVQVFLAFCVLLALSLHRLLSMRLWKLHENPPVTYFRIPSVSHNA